MQNIQLGPILKKGKTKEIIQTSNPDIVAFRQLGDSVLADGTSTLKADENGAALVAAYIAQNDNIFTYLNNMGIASTYLGRFGENLLLHKKCKPQLIEFVYRAAPCDGASCVAREPQEFGKLLGDGTYSTKEMHERYLTPEGKIIPFEKPRLETYHKLCLVEKEDGTIDMILESEAKKNPRFFAPDSEGKIKPTKFAHVDPILITSEMSTDFWDVYDQKKPVVPNNRLASIDREEGILYDLQQNKIRDMADNEIVSYEDERALLYTTKLIMEYITIAALATPFHKGDEFIGNAFPIDGKMEFGVFKRGRRSELLLTDDTALDNMRWFFGWNPKKSARSLFQNYETMADKVAANQMAAKGTEKWKEPDFVNMVKNGDYKRLVGDYVSDPNFIRGLEYIRTLTR